MLSQLDFNRIKVFYYIFNNQSVAKAARELNITQSAVSQQLKKLESEIKTRLFTRLHKRLVPTSDGQRLFSILKPFFNELELGLRSIRQDKDVPGGELRVGAPDEFGKTYLPGIFASFHRKYPKVSFSLQLGGPEKIFSLLDQGQIDFALIDEYLIQRAQANRLVHYGFEHVIDEEIVLAGSKDYCDEFVKNDFSLDNLIKQNFISYHHDALALINWFKYNFSKTSLKLNIVLRSNNLQAVLNGIKNHLGLGVVASHLVYEDIKLGRIIPITPNSEAIINRISVIQMQDKVPTLTEKEFITHFRHEIQQTSVLKEFSKIMAYDDS